jgi:predicted Zn-dependent protease
MKKILLLCVLSFLVQSASEAKDYVKHHINELKKSQQYAATNNYFTEEKNEPILQKFEIKDPKLIKLGGYEEISLANLKAKKIKDDVEYQKIAKLLASNKLNEYHMQAYGEDFYHVYRITERIIRANNLDFINWRLVIDTDVSFNAFSGETNCITINTGALDTLSNNEDALALLIGHELSHSILGHGARDQELYEGIERAKRIDNYWMHLYAKKKFYRESKKMELAADAEGAKLIVKAGYDLGKAKETISFLNTLGNASDRYSTHPKPEYRLQNYEDNIKYFINDEWIKQGRSNIYSSNVLKCEKSSNRKSIVILRNEKKSESNYYAPETPEQLYLRFGYKSYLNSEFEASIEYFKKYLNLDKTNYAVYLYLSYAYEYLYKQNGKVANLEAAKEFAGYAKSLAPDNKYVVDQVLSL